VNFLCGSQTITLTAVVILLESSRLLRWAAAKNTRRCPAEVEKPLAQPETRNTTVARSGRGRPAIPDMLGPGAKLQTRAVLLAWILVAACLCKSALAQSREGAQWSRRELLGSDGPSPGECYDIGKGAAVPAGVVACKLLKMRCSAPPILEDPPLAPELDGLLGGCRKTAETACIAFARQLVEDKECLDLLRMGPAEPVEGCERFVEAANEFNWIVKGYCELPEADDPFG